MIHLHEYLVLPSFSGNIEKDVELLFAANGERECFLHSAQVAAQVKPIAAAGNLDGKTLNTAAWLHDIGTLITPAGMLQIARRLNWRLDPTELEYPLLLHQRISALLAEELFHIPNRVILNAIRCHTTLRGNFNEYDMALFIADKLSWDEAPFREDVSTALKHSLPQASLTYMKYMQENGKILRPHRQWKAARLRLSTMQNQRYSG